MTDKEKLGELLTSFDVGFRDDDNTITPNSAEPPLNNNKLPNFFGFR